MEYKAYPVFRFDDVCINADMKLINDITDYIKEFYSGKVEIIWGISPLVHDMSASIGKHRQRVFPEIMNAYSDFREYYKVNKLGIPELRPDVTLAGHGLWHVDHRLLHYSAQEASIVTSCSLVNAKTFIPPFNKWDRGMQLICDEYDIELIKFEDGWLSMEYNKFNNHDKYYLHAREWDMFKIIKWFKHDIEERKFFSAEGF